MRKAVSHTLLLQPKNTFVHVFALNTRHTEPIFMWHICARFARPMYTSKPRPSAAYRFTDF